MSDTTTTKETTTDTPPARKARKKRPYLSLNIIATIILLLTAGYWVILSATYSPYDTANTLADILLLVAVLYLILCLGTTLLVKVRARRNRT